MATAVLRAHPLLQSKRYVHEGIEVNEVWREIELTPQVVATLREFSSGRIVAQETDENEAALATVGLGIEEGGIIVAITGSMAAPTSPGQQRTPPHRTSATAQPPSQVTSPVPPSESSRPRR